MTGVQQNIRMTRAIVGILAVGMLGAMLFGFVGGRPAHAGIQIPTTTPTQGAPAVLTITALDCGSGSGGESVTVSVSDGTDVTGMRLQSDPIQDQDYLVSGLIGSTNTSATILLFVAGDDAVNDPGNDQFVIETTAIFRNDPAEADFARIVDAAGAVVSEVACGQTLQVETPTPTLGPTDTPEATEIAATATPALPETGFGPTSGSGNGAGLWTVLAVVVGGAALATGLVALRRRSA